VLGSAVAVIVWAPLAHRLFTEQQNRVGPVHPTDAEPPATR
jgi:hypothetical protein